MNRYFVRKIACVFTALMFLVTNSAAAAMTAVSNIRAKGAKGTAVPAAMQSEMAALGVKKLLDGGTVMPLIASIDKGLLSYGVQIHRLAINNGTAHGNNYDADGNLIQTQMNLRMTKAITDALKAHDVQIVQHGVTGTPVENMPALREVGIRAAHVGTNWQNIMWDVLNEEAKTNSEVRAVVNEMIRQLVVNLGDEAQTKYGVTWTADMKDRLYVPNQDKNLDKVIGRELKNVMGANYDVLLGLPEAVSAKITAATKASALEYMKAFGSDGTAQIVRDYMAQIGVAVPSDYVSLPGKYVFDALKDTDRTIMCCNIRNPISLAGIMEAAKECGAIVVFQQAISEMSYTWPDAKDEPGNAVRLADNIRKAAAKADFHDFIIKADHTTVKVDKVFLADTAAQEALQDKFEEILFEEDLAKRDEMFSALMADADFNANPNVAKAMKAIARAVNMLKTENGAGYTAFALDASFMPMKLNVRISAFLAGYIPGAAALEAEVGEIGGDENSTVADALEFITGVRYKEEIITDRSGTKYSQLSYPKRVGILTGGGTASGHNDAILAAYNACAAAGIELVMIKDGWDGLISESSIKQSRALTYKDVQGIGGKGGTILGTSRTNPFKDPEKGNADKVWQTLHDLNLDALIALGGDDTNGVTARLHKLHPEFLFIGLPKTMDNDIDLPGGAWTYGYDSYVQDVARQVQKALRDAHTNNRIYVAEVFGRNAGFVANRVGAIVGAARTLVPEEEIDLEQLVNDVKSYQQARKFGAVIVAEGIKVSKEYRNNAKWLEAAFEKDAAAKLAYESVSAVDDFGHPKLENAALIINAVLKAAKISTSGPEKPAYMSRSAPTSPFDREITSKVGTAAVRNIVEGNAGVMLYVDSAREVKAMPLTEKLGGRELDLEGAHKDEMILANMGRASRAVLELGTPEENNMLYHGTAEFAGKITVDTRDTIVGKFRQLKPGETLELSYAGLKTLLWKLSTITAETPDNRLIYSDIARIVKRLPAYQQEQLKRLATVAPFAGTGTAVLLENALDQVVVMVSAANSLTARAGALAGFLQDQYQAGVTIAAIRSVEGRRGLDARAFVELNLHYTGLYHPFQVKGLRLGETINVNGITVDTIIVPEDKNINRPEMKILYFGSELTTKQCVDVITTLGLKVDVVTDYGAGMESAAEKQARLSEYIDQGYAVVSASPTKGGGSIMPAGLYSANRKDIGPDALIVDTLTALTNAIVSQIAFIDDMYGVESCSVDITNHDTDSSGIYAEDTLKYVSRDLTEQVSVSAEEALFSLKPELRGKVAIKEQIRTLANANYRLTFHLRNAPKNMEAITAALEAFAVNGSGGVVGYWKGDNGLNEAALRASRVTGTTKSIIDSFRIEWSARHPLELKYHGWNDNQGAGAAQMLYAWSQWVTEAAMLRKSLAESTAQADGGKIGVGAILSPAMSMIKATSAAMFYMSNSGYGSMLRLIKAADPKPVAVVTAKAIFDNPAALPAFKELKASGVDVFVWAGNIPEVTKLKMLNVDTFAEIVFSSDFTTLIAALQHKGVDTRQIALYSTGEAVEAGQVKSVTTLQKPSAGAINAVPLAVARGIAVVLKDNVEVVNQFNEMADGYKDRVPAEQLAAVTDLEQQLAAMPSVKATTDEALQQAEFDRAMLTIDSVEKNV